MTGSIPGCILVYIVSQPPVELSGKMLRKSSLLNNILQCGLCLGRQEPLDKFGNSLCLEFFIFELLVATINRHDIYFMLGIYC